MKNSISLKKAFIIILFAGIVFLGVYNFSSIVSGIGVIWRICTPFFVGIVIAFVLNMIMMPIESFLSRTILKKKKKLAKGLSIVLAYMILLAVVVTFLAFVVPELVTSISTFVGNINEYVKQLQKIVTNLSIKYELNTVDFNAILMQFSDTIKDIGNHILAYLGDMVPHVFTLMGNIVGFLFNTVMALVISANILVYKDKLTDQISRTVKAFMPKKHKMLCELAETSADTFRKYVSGQCVEALILGSLCYIGMVICRFDYALLISMVIAVTALIPVAGAYIGGAVAFILLAIISPIKAVLFLVYLVILQQIETNLIYPKVVGTSMELPGIWVIFAVTIGGGAMGVIGILFAVPIMSVIYKSIRKSVNEIEAGRTLEESLLDKLQEEVQQEEQAEEPENVLKDENHG